MQASHVNSATLLEVSPEAFFSPLGVPVKRVLDLNLPLTLSATQSYHHIDSTGRRDRDKLFRVYKVSVFVRCKRAPSNCPGPAVCSDRWNPACSTARVNELCVSTRLLEGQGPNTKRTKAGFKNPSGTLSSFCRAEKAMWEFVFVLEMEVVNYIIH